MATDGIQLVSVTHDFRFQAPDGKQRYADALDAECVQTVAKNYPNNRARKFLDWFIYSDSSIDKRDYLDAMIVSHTDSSRIHELLKGAMTDKINDREIFMKGIDYSYFYEQEE